jgi:hypothetical protein
MQSTESWQATRQSRVYVLIWEEVGEKVPKLPCGFAGGQFVSYSKKASMAGEEV